MEFKKQKEIKKERKKERRKKERKKERNNKREKTDTPKYRLLTIENKQMVTGGDVDRGRSEIDEADEEETFLDDH